MAVLPPSLGWGVLSSRTTKLTWSFFSNIFSSSRLSAIIGWSSIPTHSLLVVARIFCPSNLLFVKKWSLSFKRCTLIHLITIIIFFYIKAYVNLLSYNCTWTGTHTCTNIGINQFERGFYLLQQLVNKRMMDKIAYIDVIKILNIW